MVSTVKIEMVGRKQGGGDTLSRVLSTRDSKTGTHYDVKLGSTVSQFGGLITLNAGIKFVAQRCLTRFLTEDFAS
jgi:hypothetical protein